MTPAAREAAAALALAGLLLAGLALYVWAQFRKPAAPRQGKAEVIGCWLLRYRPGSGGEPAVLECLPQSEWAISFENELYPIVGECPEPGR